MSSCLLYNSWGGRSNMRPLLTQSCLMTGSHSLKGSSSKNICFFKGRKPEGTGNPALRRLRSAARAGLRANQCVAAWLCQPAALPNPSQKKFWTKRLMKVVYAYLVKQLVD